MVLRKLLIAHAIVTFAAAMTLIVTPEFIPKTVGIQLDPDAYLLSYFLGAAELSIAYLSFFAARLKDVNALKLICTSFIVFHLSTAAVEVYAFTQGVSAVIWGNVVLRLLISVLFVRFGLQKTAR